MHPCINASHGSSFTPSSWFHDPVNRDTSPCLDQWNKLGQTQIKLGSWLLSTVTKKKHTVCSSNVTPLTNTAASFTPLAKLLIFVIQSDSLDNSTWMKTAYKQMLYPWQATKWCHSTSTLEINNIQYIIWPVRWPHVLVLMRYG